MGISTTRALAVGATFAALGLAATPAFAADGPGPATVQGWAFDYTVHKTTPVTTTEAGRIFSSLTGGASGAPLVGITESGRVNASTGLYYPQVSAFDADDPFAGSAKVTIAAPVIGTTGIPTLSTSATDLKVSCESDSDGNATGAVNVSGSVPLGNTGLVSPNTTVYLPRGATGSNYEMKVVYNEQTRLPNGQLQVTGMHVTFDVPHRALGSEAVTGDARYGIATCGKVNDAEETPVPIASAGVAGGALGLSALVGGGVAAARRRRGN